MPKRKLEFTQVKVQVTLNVHREDFSDPKLSIKDIRAAAVEAVDECLNHGQNRGFNHGLSDIVSIGLDKVEIAPPDAADLM